MSSDNHKCSSFLSGFCFIHRRYHTQTQMCLLSKYSRISTSIIISSKIVGSVYQQLLLTKLAGDDDTLCGLICTWLTIDTHILHISKIVRTVNFHYPNWHIERWRIGFFHLSSCIKLFQWYNSFQIE